MADSIGKNFSDLTVLTSLADDDVFVVDDISVSPVQTKSITASNLKSFIALSASATLDFPSISASGQEELTITVTGAATGDSVALGLPAAIESGLTFDGYVSAVDTVAVRAQNITGSPIDPASATFTATVFK